MVIADPYPPRLCSVPDCGRKHRAKSYCKKHYQHFIIRQGRTRGASGRQPLGPNFWAAKGLLATGLQASQIARQLHISRQRVSQLAKKIAREKRKALAQVV